MNGWLFTHPSMRGIDIDDPRLTAIRFKLLRQKKFLFKLYKDWYSLLKQNLGNPNSRVIELGSGEGFLENLIPNVVKTDLFHHGSIHLVMDGLQLPLSQKARMRSCFWMFFIICRMWINSFRKH